MPAREGQTCKSVSVLLKLAIERLIHNIITTSQIAPFLITNSNFFAVYFAVIQSSSTSAKLCLRSSFITRIKKRVKNSPSIKLGLKLNIKHKFA